MFDTTATMEFDLTFLDELSVRSLQLAIDGVNAEFTSDSGVWNFVSNGGLIEAYRARSTHKIHPTAEKIFTHMDEEGHSGFSAWWTITNLTHISRNYPERRDILIKNILLRAKKDIISAVQRHTSHANLDNIHLLPPDFVRKHLPVDAKNTLEYTLKKSHMDPATLTNELLLEHIDRTIASLETSSHTAP